jgi:7-cyano-7-deazaguanine synthase
MKNKKAVVLLSGGLDSAVTLFLARNQGFRCHCLIFDYGQRHHREIESAKKIAGIAGCAYRVLKIALPWKGSALLDRTMAVRKARAQASPKGERPSLVSAIPGTYVPARNTIFLSFALSFAETIGAGAIFIGAHAQDYSGYPDCRPQFFKAFGKVISAGTKAGIEHKNIVVKAPLINKGKAAIIRLGRKLGVPFELTWSCYRGGKVPCGKCDSCYYRQKGLEEAG